MFYTLLITYLVGGLTFIPLLIAASICLAIYTEDPVKAPSLKPTHAKPAKPLAADTKATTLKAWLTVRRTFEASPSTYIAFVRGLLDSRSSNPRKAEDSYYTALKGNVLYLYEDETMSECVAVIDVSRCTVRIFPEAGLLDGELFAKRNAILVTENRGEAPEIVNNNSDDNNEVGSGAASPPAPWYIFFRSVTVMEDWYLALLAAQSLTPPPYPYAPHAALISSLDALPDLIPTRWLNAIIGRLFLGVKGTKAVEAWVIGRLMKKLAKVKKPGFLTSVVVRSFEAGDAAPVLSKPMLKELTPKGEASIGVDISYVAPPGGEMRITVSATATISLPSTPLSILGFSGKNKEKETPDKPYEVSLVLAIVMRKVTGNILLKIKGPPSNRLWYAFTTMPHMEMTVEPVVSDRQIRWGMVLSVIESKLREVIQESVVLPYMDDIPFFDTTSYNLRGGIFADAFTRPATSTTTTASTTTATTVTNDTSATFIDTNTEPGKASADAKQLAEALIGVDNDWGVFLGRIDSLSEGNARKRRSWFGKKGDDGETDASVSGSDHRRGKSDDMASSSGISVYVTDGEEGRSSLEVPPETPVPPTAAPFIRRAHSQTSRVVSDGAQKSPSPPHSPVDGGSGLSRSLPSSSPIPSTTPPTSPQPTGSFLANLKSRSAVMAEKQPSLKEAMRKFGVGVNWAQGLRKTEKEKEKEKEKETKDVKKERGRSRERDDWEIEGDHGELWGPNARKDASARGSYADLRRKVELREKERERREGSASNGDLSSSRPIDIPGSFSTPNTSIIPPDHDMSRSPSQRSHASISPTSKASPSNGASFLTPSAPRTTTEVHTAMRPSSPSPLASQSGFSAPPRDSEPHKAKNVSLHPQPHAHPQVVSPLPEPTPSVPIRAQPRAATMTIPGIHASHRGEVMALGSEPKLPKPSETEQPSLPVQGKGIQRLYTRFRGGGEGVREPEDGMKRPSASSSSIPTVPPTPPPLPPRAQSQAGTPMASTFLPEGEETSSRGSNDLTLPPAPPILSPASQALKNVAELDAARKPPPILVRRPTGQGPRSPAPSFASAEAEPRTFVSSPAISPCPSPVKSAQIPAQAQAQARLQSQYQSAEDTDAVKTPVTASVPEERWRPPLPPRRGTGGSVQMQVQVQPSDGEVLER